MEARCESAVLLTLGSWDEPSVSWAQCLERGGYARHATLEEVMFVYFFFFRSTLKSKLLSKLDSRVGRVGGSCSDCLIMMMKGDRILSVLVPEGMAIESTGLPIPLARSNSTTGLRTEHGDEV